MTFKKQFLAVTLFAASPLALAGMAQVSGDTSCTAIESKDISQIIDRSEQIMTLDCRFEADVGGSMTYLIEQVKFIFANGFVIETDNSATFDFDDNGKAQNIEPSVTLNGEDAEVLTIDLDKLEVLDDTELAERYETDNLDFDKLLTCYTTSSNSGLFCFPYTLLDDYK